MKQCITCLKAKNTNEFNKNKTKKDGLQSECRICSRNRYKRNYAHNKKKYAVTIKRQKRKIILENQKRLFAFLQAHCCTDCGLKNPLTLEFDHVRGSKFHDISNLLKWGYSWNTIEKEISKCEIRCRNCHSVKTHKEQNSYRYKFLQKY